MANESEAIQLKFGLSLQQIMDVVSDAFIKLVPASPDWARQPTAHTLISSRLGGNVFSKKIKHFQSNFTEERSDVSKDTVCPQSDISLKVLSVITMQIYNFGIIRQPVTLALIYIVQ